MKLSEVIRIWDRLHLLNIGNLAFCELADAIEAEIGIENDISSCLPS